MASTKPLKIAITGGTGLVGSRLVPMLLARGHEVRILSRGTKEGQWNPEGLGDLRSISGFDAVIHLAGETISKRWSAVQREKIRSSRISGTANLLASLLRIPEPPSNFISASAIGFYGDRPFPEVLDEKSLRGKGFLADVVSDWESAVSKAASAGMRSAQLRFGIILSPEGGALKRMLLPFKLGLGGKIGSGEQGMSWVALEDVCRAIVFSVESDISGPLNVTGPNPVAQALFAKELAAILHRPSIFPMPGFVVKFLFGEMGEQLLLAGQRVIPRKLMDAGFEFSCPSVGDALSLELGLPKRIP